MRANLERAGKVVTPAPPRWEGSWRISSVTDLCYVLRRTLQALVCAVNRTLCPHSRANATLVSVYPVGSQQLLLWLRTFASPSCSSPSAPALSSSAKNASTPTPLAPPPSYSSHLYVPNMPAPQSRVIQSFHGSHNKKPRNSRRNSRLLGHARTHPDAFRLPRRRRNTRRFSRGIPDRIARIRHRCSRRSETPSPRAFLNAHFNRRVHR